MKVSKKLFNTFKAECEKWLKILGLNDWQVHYRHEKINNRAEIHFDCVGRLATIILSTSWPGWDQDLVNEENIKRSAFHEVCELLLGPLNDMVGQRYGLNVDDKEEEIHRVIRTLENTLFEARE